MNSDNITIDHNGETHRLGVLGTPYIDVNTGETVRLVGACFDLTGAPCIVVLDEDETIQTETLHRTTYMPHPDHFAA